MAIIQALLAAITRWAGTILNTAFSWATMMLFGKIPRAADLCFDQLARIGAVADRTTRNSISRGDRIPAVLR
jgi:hypothetical protein